MNIGSAKIKPEEMDGIHHYLVDVLEPDEEFHVVRFQQMAKDALDEIYAKGKIPIIVGGTGFYIQALLYDIDIIYLPSALKDMVSFIDQLQEIGNAACFSVSAL